MTDNAKKVPIAVLAELTNGFPFKSSDFSNDSEVPLVRIRDLVAANFETFVPRASVPDHVYLKKNDVVIGMDGDFNVQLWDRGEAALNQRLCFLRMVGDNDSRFLAYVLPSELKKVNDTTPSTTVKHLSSGDVLAIRVPDIDPRDQKRIADYLDRETGEIDAMLAKMDELTQTLEARRKHVIMTETRQIGLTAGFDSGGRLPDGWSLTPLRFAVADAQTGVWGEEPNGGDDDVLCARVADFDRAKLRVTDVPTIRRVAAKDRDKCSLRRGDILVEKSGGTNRNPVGTVISYEGEIPAVYANFIMRLRMAKGHNSRFWLYALHGSYSNGRTWNFVRQTTGIQNLDVNGFLSMPHAAPLLDEQIRIADHLDEITGKIDQMLAKTAELKNLLIERRAALITDVVTGKKQVP